LELGPDSWTGNYYLGLALFGLSRFEEAEKSAREALHWRVAFPEAYLLLARIHSHEEDYPSLVSDLNEYLKIAPDGAAVARAKTLREYAQRMIIESQHTTALAQPQP
jgi:tetratricopeptide (TPR) repeat protein